MNEQLLQIAKELKALGARILGAPVWVKASDTPKWVGVAAQVQSNKVNGTTLSSLQIPAEDGGFFPVRLAKGVPANKASYDIYLYKAVRAFPDTEEDKKRFPNVTPIKVGDISAFAH